MNDLSVWIATSRLSRDAEQSMLKGEDAEPTKGRRPKGSRCAIRLANYYCIRDGRRPPEEHWGTRVQGGCFTNRRDATAFAAAGILNTCQIKSKHIF